MSSQVYLARMIVEGRAHTEQNKALVRTVELARHHERRAARGRRARR